MKVCIGNEGLFVGGDEDTVCKGKEGVSIGGDGRMYWKRGSLYS